MGRSYAGILGGLAFLAVLARGVITGAAAEGTIAAASLCLLVFAAVGYVVGQLAGWIVEESLKSQVAQRLQAQEASRPQGDRSDNE